MGIPLLTVRTMASRLISFLLPVLALFALAACGPADVLADSAEEDAAANSSDRDMRLEISLSARELYVFMNGEIVDEYPVAVGQPGHETPTGTWEVFRIDWNPDWTPPDSEWAADREYKPPGHPDNPMGRVRMVFNPPYTVHGTDVYDSLGQAASHGSIRMGNEDIIELAPRVMYYGGEPRTEEWVEAALDHSEEMVEIHLPDPVRIDIIP